MNLAKTNLVLAGAAIVLAIPTWLTLRSERELFTDVGQIPRLFEGFSSDQVAAIVIGEPKPAATPPANQSTPSQPDKPNKPQVEYESLQFRRAEKGFVIAQGAGDLTGAPINKDLLEANVFKHLTDIRADKQALVQPAASDEQLAEYGLDDAQAFVVKAVNAQGDTLAELLVGKDASGGKFGTEVVRGVFVRRRESSDVVLYEVPYFQRSVKPEIWLDRTLLKAPADQVRKVTLRNPSTGAVTHEFTRPAGQGSWQCMNPPADKGALRQQEFEQQLVQRFQWLVAQEFKRQKQTANLKELELQPPRTEVGVTWQDGDQEKTVVFAIGGAVEGKQERYLLSSASSFLMTWPDGIAAIFERDIGEIFDPGAPKPEAPPKEEAAKDEPKKEEPRKVGPPKDETKKDEAPNQEPKQEPGTGAPGPAGAPAQPGPAKPPAQEPAKEAPKPAPPASGPPPAPTPTPPAPTPPSGSGRTGGNQTGGSPTGGNPTGGNPTGGNQ